MNPDTLVLFKAGANAPSLELEKLKTPNGEIRSRIAEATLNEALKSSELLKTSAMSANTLRSYASDWRQFERFCNDTQVIALPATPKVLELYLGYCAHNRVVDGKRRTLKASSMARHLAAIDHVHHYFNYEKPSRDSGVRRTLMGYRNQGKKAVSKKAALTPADLKKMVDCCPTEGHRGLRDRALLLLGFASACRRAELVSLCREDVGFEYQPGQPKTQQHVIGVRLFIENAKGDKEKSGQMVVVPTATNPEYCPVRALSDWLAMDYVGDPYVFIRITKGDTALFKEEKGKEHPDDPVEYEYVPKRLTPQSVALLVKNYARQACLESPGDFSGHSFRRGWITAAAQVPGMTPFKIAAHSRHKSMDVLNGYIEDATALKDHPGSDLL